MYMYSTLSTLWDRAVLHTAAGVSQRDLASSTAAVHSSLLAATNTVDLCALLSLVQTLSEQRNARRCKFYQSKLRNPTLQYPMVLSAQ